MTQNPKTDIGCFLFSLVGAFGIFMFISVILILAMLMFWLFIFFDCMKHQKKDREFWMIVTFFGGIPGSIIYLCCRDKKKNIPVESQAIQK